MEMDSNPSKKRPNNGLKEEPNLPFKAERNAQISHPHFITSTVMFRLS